MLTQICWHHLDLQKLNTAEDQVRSKSLTPRNWNIKTAKLQRALAICCGRQRAAKCFVKSTKVKKPQRGHRSDIQSGSLICENASVPTVFHHFPYVFHLLSIISQDFPYCVPSFPYVPYAFHHVPMCPIWFSTKLENCSIRSTPGCWWMTCTDVRPSSCCSQAISEWLDDDPRGTPMATHWTPPNP